MSTLIHGGTVVSGPGTSGPGALIVRDGLISDVVGAWDSRRDFDGEVIDATGCVVMPGLINSHTHGVTPGAFMPSGAQPLTNELWMRNLDRHLLAGTTTVLNLCGFSGMDDVLEADRRHAVNVRGATSHFPSTLRAARLADGGGVAAHDRSALWSAESMVAAGAVAIGELGGGQTLGGGGQDLVYIPAAVEAATGVRISSFQARELKEAALSRFVDPREFDGDRFAAAVEAAGLVGHIGLPELRKLITSTVMPSIEPAISGIREGVAAARNLGVPAIVHSASATAAVLAELLDEPPHGGAQVVAAHANHPSHTPDEALALARRGRDAGWRTEVSVFDLLYRRHTVDTREHWDALLSEPGLVDIVATDYGSGGDHDELIGAIQDMVQHGFRSLPRAVAMATSTVAQVIPGIAPGRGDFERGRVADVVVAGAEDFRDVRFVFVDGVCVVRDGSLTKEAHR